jgi:hypothetical protein
MDKHDAFVAANYQIVLDFRRPETHQGDTLSETRQA